MKRLPADMRRLCAAIAVVLAHAVAGGAAPLTINLDFAPTDLVFSAAAGGTLVELRDGTLLPGEPGEPWLPARDINVLVPRGVSVRSIAATALYTRVVQTNIFVVPRQREYPLSLPRPRPALANAAAYASRTTTPGRLAELTGVHTQRGFTYASIRVCPLQYNPAARVLQLVGTVRLTITLAPTLLQTTDYVDRNRLFASFVRANVVNPAALDAELRKPATDARTGAANDYLIITSAALTGAFARLAAHRASFSGMTTALVAVEDITATYPGRDVQEQIRNCIRAYVISQGTEYVVLGGDSAVVPDRDCHVSIDIYDEPHMPTDLYYSGLDGTWDDCNTNNVFGEADIDGDPARNEGDLAPDVIVGRIPVRSSADARAYIDKLIRIETNLPPTPAVRRMLLAGVTLWDSYTGAARPRDAVADGLPGFQDHARVSDAEMWRRRMYRDAIQPFWRAEPLRLFCDTLTSWDNATAGDYALSRANLVTRFNEGWRFFAFDTHGAVSIWAAEGDWFSTADAASLSAGPDVIYTIACDTGAFDLGEPCLSEAFIRNPNCTLVYIGCSRYGWGSPDEPPASAFSFGGSSTAYEREFYRQLFDPSHPTIGAAFARHKAAKIAASGNNYVYRWLQFGLNLQGDPAIRLPLDYGVHLEQSICESDSGADGMAEPGENVGVRIWLRNEDMVSHTATATLISTHAELHVAPPETHVYGMIPAGMSASNTTLFTVGISADAPAGTYPLHLEIASDSGVRSNTFDLTVVRRPAIMLSATNVTIIADGDAMSALSISNAGSAALSWQVCGGSNYLWCAGTPTNGPTFTWIAPGPDATPVAVGDDDVSAYLPLASDFYFYGVRCTNLLVGSNGAIGLAPGFLDGNNQLLPCLVDNGFPMLIAPFWDDLDPGSSGAVRLHTNDGTTVVSFLGVRRLNQPAQTQTFQCVLGPDGRIVFQYHTMRGVTDSATIGVQEDNMAGRYLEIAFNTPLAADGLALELYPPPLPPWLTVSNVCGAIAPSGTATLWLHADAAMAPSDTCSAIIHVWHNDDGAQRWTPVTVTFVVPEPAVNLIGLLLLLRRAAAGRAPRERSLRAATRFQQVRQ
jgi:hypothetical protein